jgi:hypothetical protein
VPEVPTEEKKPEETVTKKRRPEMTEEQKKAFVEKMREAKMKKKALKAEPLTISEVPLKTTLRFRNDLVRRQRKWRRI